MIWLTVVRCLRCRCVYRFDPAAAALPDKVLLVEAD